MSPYGGTAKFKVSTSLVDSPCSVTCREPLARTRTDIYMYILKRAFSEGCALISIVTYGVPRNSRERGLPAVCLRRSLMYYLEECSSMVLITNVIERIFQTYVSTRLHICLYNRAPSILFNILDCVIDQES